MTTFKTMFAKLAKANPETQFAVDLKKRTAIVGSLSPEALSLPSGWTVNDTTSVGGNKVFITNFSSDEANEPSKRVFFEYVQSQHQVKLNKFALWFANLTWR